MQKLSSKNISLTQYRKLQERFSNWGKWGKDDQLGTLNYITPETVRAAAGEVRMGKVFSLAIALDKKGPQTGAAGRFNPILLMTRDGGDAITGAYPVDWMNGTDKEVRSTDEVIIMPTQGGTHWDSLAHIIHKEVMYNGWKASEVSSTGAKKNGIFNWRQKVVGRGVLLDVARTRKAESLGVGEGIGGDLLEETARKQKVDVREGDIVLVRTGHMGAARKRGSWGDFAGGDQPGLSIHALEWAKKNRIAAIASDTWGLEVQPFEVKEVQIPFHILAIVYMGLPLGEMFDLDALAEECAREKRYSCFLAAQPLPFTKGVASPINPVAIM